MTLSSRMKWPIPSEGQQSYYAAFQRLIEAIDASVYASREDRQMFMFGGAWTLVGDTLTWDADLTINSNPAGFIFTVAAGSTTILDGQVLYVNLIRSPLSSATITVQVADRIPTDDSSYLLGIRNGSVFYARNNTGIPADNSVHTAQIVDGAVTANKLAPSSVTDAAVASTSNLGRFNSRTTVVVPTGVAATDTAAIKAALAAMAGVGEVRLAPGSHVWNEAISVPSKTLLVGHPNASIVAALFNGGAGNVLNAPLYAVPVTTGSGDTTLASDATIGARTISTVASIPAGTIVRISWASSTLRSLFYVVTSVSGAGPYTLTLDRPIVEKWLSGDPVVRITSRPTDITIEGCGMRISGPADRWFEFVSALRCELRNVRMDVADGHLRIADSACASFDIGSEECAMRGVRANSDGYALAGGGLLLESSERCELVDCSAAYTGGNGMALWDCWGCRVVRGNAVGNTYGVYLGSDGLAPRSGYYQGCYDCTIEGGSYRSNQDGVSINGPSARTSVRDVDASRNTASGVAINVAGTYGTSLDAVTAIGNAKGIYFGGATVGTRCRSIIATDNTTYDIDATTGSECAIDGLTVSGAAPTSIHVGAGTCKISRATVDNTYSTGATNVVLVDFGGVLWIERSKITATKAGSSLLVCNSSSSKLYLRDVQADTATMGGLAMYGTSDTYASGECSIVSPWAVDANARLHLAGIEVVGTPEGAVPGVPGSWVRRTNGGAATSLYVKEANNTVNGWVGK